MTAREKLYLHCARGHTKAMIIIYTQLPFQNKKHMKIKETKTKCPRRHPNMQGHRPTTLPTTSLQETRSNPHHTPNHHCCTRLQVTHTAPNTYRTHSPPDRVNQNSLPGGRIPCAAHTRPADRGPIDVAQHRAQHYPHYARTLSKTPRTRPSPRAE